MSPDWSAPIDTDAVLSEIPGDITAKGMFFAGIQQELSRGGHARGPAELAEKKYTAYRDYPMQDLARLEVFAVQHIYPDIPTREALRRLGAGAYQTFAESLVGRVVFGVLDGSPGAIVKAASKGYRRTMSRGRGEAVETGKSHAIVHLSDVWNFPDCYQVGVMEGGLQYLGYEAESHLVVRGPAEVFVRLDWTRR